MPIVSIFIVFFISACSSMQQGQTQHNVSDIPQPNRYEILLDRVKKQPDLASIIALRQVSILSDRYPINTTTEQTLNQQLFKALANGNWSLCLEKANALLAHNYISLNGHYGAMACSVESGEIAQGQYHQSLLNMLLEAIWTTGNGESLRSAFLSTNTIEIDAFIEFHGLELVHRTLMQNEGKVFDLTTLKDPKSGEQFNWYFEISTEHQHTQAID